MGKGGGGGGLTFSVVAPATAPSVAVMLDVPGAAAVASPAALMVATVPFDDAQVTRLVRSPVEPSENVPVAWSCCVPPRDSVGFAGVTAMDWSVAVFTASPVEPVTPFSVALR